MQKKELPKNRGPHANVLKTGRTQKKRQATEHVGKRGLPEERQLGVDVGIQRPKDGDVARNELRHDTTSSLRTDEQEDEVQEQQAQQPCERFARREGHQTNLGSACQRSRATRVEFHREVGEGSSLDAKK